MKKFSIFLKISIGLLSFIMLFSSCDADVEIDRSFDEILSAQPTITTFSPQSASVLEEVTVEGTYLNFVTKAFIDGVESKITQRVNSEQLKIQVPPEATQGSIKLVTEAEMETTSDEELIVNYPEPEIASEIPEESVVNENIVLEGENMNVITKVTFGESEGVIEFKSKQSIVVKTPNDINSPMDLQIWYYSPEGEVSESLNSAYRIDIPKPTVSAWPSLMSRYQDITVSGENMNLIDSVFVGGEFAPILTASPTGISFEAPGEIVTGFQNITFKYAEVNEITEENIPYINGQLQTYYDWDTYSEDAVDLDLSKDPLAMHMVNGDVPQPPLPEGDGYYHLEMGTATGSTIARVQFHETSENATWVNILDDGNYNNNPVLHMWVNTVGTEPNLKIYIGGTGSDNRRELTGSNLNTGEDWKLIAIRLNGFIPDINSVGSVFELRINTGSSASNLPIILNLDWIIVTDKVLTEFGAVDVTDEFKPAG